MRIPKFVLAFLLLAVTASAQNTKTYTLTFDHDGLLTESYAVEIDGARTAITPVCVVTNSIRTCTSPLTLTTGVDHSIKVVAIGIFGEGVADPFVCKIPGKPGNTKVGK